MPASRCFVHIGLPKCASTSLQAALGRADDIHYAGYLTDRPDGGYWRNPQLALLFDRELRFACADAGRYRQVVSDFIAEGGARTTVFSSENIALRFLPWDLPTHVKLAYLAQVFPTDCRFIYVYRNPLALLESLYKEWLMLGYRRGHGEFVADAFRFRDISFFHDLCLGRFLQQFDAALGLDRLQLVSMDLADPAAQLSAILGVPLQLPSEPMNPSLGWEEMAMVRRLNDELHDYDPFYDSIEYHRAFFDLADESRKYATARRRRQRRAMAGEMVQFAGEAPNIIEPIPAEILDYLIEDLGLARRLLPADTGFADHLDRYQEQLDAAKL